VRNATLQILQHEASVLSSNCVDPLQHEASVLSSNCVDPLHADCQVRTNIWSDQSSRVAWDDDDLDDGPPGHKIVSHATLTKDEWAEVFCLRVRGKVPSSWCEAINNNPNFSLSPSQRQGAHESTCFKSGTKLKSDHVFSQPFTHHTQSF
jgi:hypothetical protein